MKTTIGGAVWISGVFAATLLLAGCGSTSASDVFGNLLAFNSPKAPPIVKKPDVAVDVGCPEVSVQDGAGTIRVYAGADHSNESVKYQIDIAQFARQCDARDGQLAIKVGVQGRLVLGPVGSSGSYDVPVQIAIKRQSDDSVVVQHLYQTHVDAQSGETTFETISDPLVVPISSKDPSAEYAVVVGLDQGAPLNAKPKLKARSAKKS